ncbi:calcium-binding protein [Celeribacter litoreus]|uniref:calcium-binding protein n=1 Tax=Celeribacter litoreus TaxID=2876714 RepID=UPI0021E307ED|nr:M10 family metallopeptidase C-terminal domain-containing protein [Celeribacter litoreus]
MDYRGTKGRDIIEGTIWDDRLLLEGGSDIGSGKSGNDTIRGNNGSDTLIGGRGDDVLYGGGSNDRHPLEDGEHGNDGDDILYGGSGDDLLFGGADSDTLRGGDDDDTLVGGSGNDWLSGGAGADVFMFLEVAQDRDKIVDFEQGLDVIDLSRIDTSQLTFRGELEDVGDGRIRPFSVNYYVADDKTVIGVEATGDRRPDLTIVLTGEFSLTADDFIL